MTETLSPIGFWSYARQDDEEKLSGLRSILQRQLQQKYGREPIKIFQDVAAIPPGADWNNKITEALHSSTFLIPIITPNFLESEWCNQEFFLFLERDPAHAGRPRVGESGSGGKRAIKHDDPLPLPVLPLRLLRSPSAPSA